MAERRDEPAPVPVLKPAPHVLIVVAPYYRDIAAGLLAGAHAVLARAGARVDLAEVPGALEIPPAIALARSRFDGFVALGCILRGETTHYETVCSESARGLMDLALAGVCLGNGILTVETLAQAQVRADPAGQDKGGGAALAALSLIALKRRFA
jgi:6,7-dimethyl-8-ribityllumazine synthase